MTRQTDPGRPYRRGLFLGLTTAEISLLLVFALLLLFTQTDTGNGTDDAPDRKEMEELRQQVREAVQHARAREAAEADRDRWMELLRNAEETIRRAEAGIAQLRRSRGTLQRQVAALREDLEDAASGEELERMTELERELVRVNRTSAERQEAVHRLQEEIGRLEATLEEETAGAAGAAETGRLRDRVEELNGELTKARAEERFAERTNRALRERIAELERENEGLRGTGPGGTGSDHPSCWYDDEGDEEYLWDVALHEDGFFVREGPPRKGGASRAAAGSGATETGRYLSRSEFVEQTRPVFLWSVAENCRFFVRVWDETPRTAKALYQDRIRTVEGHFYKNENPTGPAPRP